jgi:uncharacterized protein DUF6494
MLQAAARGSTSARGEAQPACGAKEATAMNEDRFNMDIRKFLKVVGVTSQREIETAVRAGLAKGALADGAVLKPRITLSVPEIGLEHVVEGEIGLS